MGARAAAKKTVDQLLLLYTVSCQNCPLSPLSEFLARSPLVCLISKTQPLPITHESLEKEHWLPKQFLEPVTAADEGTLIVPFQRKPENIAIRILLLSLPHQRKHSLKVWKCISSFGKRSLIW